MSSSDKISSMLSSGGARPKPLSAGIMAASSMLFFLITVVFVISLHMYVKRRWGSAAVRERELLSAPNQGLQALPTRCKGLDAAFVQSLPVSVYRGEEDSNDEGALECSVCLSELVDGQNARFLPKCNHGFHLDCIDTWFASHSTCPICRNLVGPESTTDDDRAAVLTDGYSTTEALRLPTNVLFWGTQDEVSTGGVAVRVADQERPSSSSNEGMLVIEIPNRAGVGGPPSEEKRSPIAAARSRLRSFKRLFSRGKFAAAGTSYSADVEQGVAGQ